MSRDHRGGVTVELVIVACGTKKAPKAQPACDLYVGPYYRACAAYAHTLVRWRRIRILSALHGLLELDQRVKPYDVRLGDAGAISADTLRKQAAEVGLLPARRVIVLGGRKYVALAREVWPHAESPLEGVGGIGMQIKTLREWARERKAA